MAKAPEYDCLIGEPVDDDDEAVRPPTVKRYFSRTVLAILLAVETLASTIAIFVLSTRTQTTCSIALPSQHALYSPALEAVEYEARVFYGGSEGDLSPFHLPSSPELDEMWHNLYKHGVSRITKDEAVRLPNKTHPIPGDNGHYIAELDVFHNLHCLDKIRMALDPDYYSDWRISTTNNFIPSQIDATAHILHCVDYVRQSLMCSGDTSMLVWQWHDAINKTTVEGNTAHTCRNFDNLLDWAKQRELPDAYDASVHIEDDIVIPVFHTESS
ncbi:hypothetical protein MSAN_01825700 [Mycena sanguinolenta]|uniref:Tat pathway signal sequence n=1 Tax=Mycena sanguinolenta TaxID=230812 RepID=A0A8H6XRU3_9AGAR|nr:hypothetical protein MSAN_01825700 [Mycena sanguinolenta]